MPSFYLDSSALFKRYVQEKGTPWVVSLLAPSIANHVFLSRITGVEVVSALVRQTPPLPAADLSKALSGFRQDLVSQYQLIEVSTVVVDVAMDCAERHRLRGYDAVQLASAPQVHNVQLALHSTPITFVSSDLRLNAAASAEGLIVDNPEDH